jgi:hypothetical protein
MHGLLCETSRKPGFTVAFKREAVHYNGNGNDDVPIGDRPILKSAFVSSIKI